jgi:hypothetical protein
MKMGTIRRMQGDVGNQEYDLHYWVQNTLYQSSYQPVRKLYLPFSEWYSDMYTKFPEVLVSLMTSPFSSYLSLALP